MTSSIDPEHKRSKSVLSLLGLSLLLVGILVFFSSRQVAVTPPDSLVGVLRHDFKTLQPFELSDHNDGLFNEISFNDKWSFVFFGYTSCPDICPITLSVLNSMLGMLEADSENVLDDIQVMLVSVDPARDDSESLAKYVSHFNRDFIGLTGSKQQIDLFAQQFGAGYVFEEETTPGHYTIAHTSAIFLVDPAGRLVSTFSQPHYAQTIAKQFKQIRTYLL